MSEKKRKICVIIFWVSFFVCFISLDLYKIESIILDGLFIVSFIIMNIFHVIIIIDNIKKRIKGREKQ
jgi:hypothetical protein